MGEFDRFDSVRKAPGAADDPVGRELFSVFRIVRGYREGVPIASFSHEDDARAWGDAKYPNAYIVRHLTRTRDGKWRAPGYDEALAERAAGAGFYKGRVCRRALCGRPVPIERPAPAADYCSDHCDTLSRPPRDPWKTPAEVVVEEK